MIGQYQTTDMMCAATLRALGFELKELSWSGKRASFVFEYSQVNGNLTPEQYIQEFWNKRIQIDARTLLEAEKELKTRVKTELVG